MHINIYGPKASGKTRFAEEFKTHYRCDHVVDEGKVTPLHSPAGNAVLNLPRKGRSLILTIDPVNAGHGVPIQHVTIYQALREIGQTGATR